jgi:hypothetical protein
MTFTRTAVVLLAGAGLLAACSQPGGNTAASSSAAAASATLATGPDVAINEADLPHPKLGMWVVTSSFNGRPPHVDHNCTKVDQSINLRKNLSRIGQVCSVFTLKRTFLGAYVLDATCGARGVSSTIHDVIHGDFTGGSYTTDTTAHMTLAGRPPMDFTTHSEAKWLGPC